MWAKARKHPKFKEDSREQGPKIGIPAMTSRETLYSRTISTLMGLPALTGQLYRKEDKSCHWVSAVEWLGTRSCGRYQRGT